MRDGDWKVLARLNLNKFANPVHKLGGSVHNHNAARVKAATLSDFQIFKITDDIGESQDLSATHPEKLSELKKRLTLHYRELVNDSHVWDIQK